MESYKVENLSFAYPNSSDKALRNISFTVGEGEFVLICGSSGCGKTTLLRLLKSCLSPTGTLDGSIDFRGKPLSSYDTKAQAAGIGFVMQNPDNGIVTDKVWHELAFGLESLGCKTPEIRARVSEMASFFGIQNRFYQNVAELSGGQKQLLNLASVMVMQPSVLILDEPTSQLDPIAAEEFLKMLEKINRELGVAVILTEHRLEDAFSIADRVIVMDRGEIIADGSPCEVGTALKSLGHEMYKALPTPMRVHGAVENDLACPITVREGRAWLEEYAFKNKLNSDAVSHGKPPVDGEAVIEVKDAWFRYEKNLPDAVKGLDITVNKGEIYCILGGNGSGKTTALSLICGLNKPYRGEVKINGRSVSKIGNLYDGLLGVLPQDPRTVFVKKTVYLDLLDMLSERRLTKAEREQKIRSVAEICRIEGLLDGHPYDLSGGEQQRAALAKILLAEPQILLLDEPTKGMDACFKEEFAHILLELKECGVTVVTVSHDIEFCAEYADRCALMFDGSVTSEGAPREFFGGKCFYTTAAARMARTRLPEAVLAEDIILACGGKLQKGERKKRKLGFLPKKTEDAALSPQNDIKAASERMMLAGKRLSGRTLAAALMILLLIPLTIFAGVYYLGDRKYYFISLLIILETMIPFFMVFEAGKPQARELIIISVLCGIAVAGRAAFFMLPQFKPVTAVVIIAGICFGGETGFLVGAVTGFVSNFFAGQGPWTPWQMFAFGIVGFAAGILFGKGFLRKRKTSLCIFGFAATFVLYGGIMNPASVIMSQNQPTFEMIMSAYAVGIPFDLIHAFSTAFFLWFISEPMIDKLERVKVKYGLIEG